MKTLLTTWLSCLSLLATQVKDLNSAQEFNDLIATNDRPVVVQFSAYWCEPCHRLRAAFDRLAPNYTDTDLGIAMVDAYVNKDLQKYLGAGYPTTRCFHKGVEVRRCNFVGSQTDEFLTQFLDAVKGLAF